MTDDIEAKLELDCRGLNCPLPMMKTNKAIAGLASGDVLKVLLTDPGSAADMDNFSERTGHEILDRREADGEFVFYVRKV